MKARDQSITINLLSSPFSKGEKEKTRELALKSLAVGLDITAISQITGLSEQEIQALIKNSSK